LGIASDVLQYNRKHSKYQLKVVKESIRKTFECNVQQQVRPPV